MSIQVIYKKWIRHGYARVQSDGSILVTIPVSLRGQHDFYDALLCKAQLLQKKLDKKIIWKPIQENTICIFGTNISRKKIAWKHDLYLSTLLYDFVAPLCDIYASVLGKNYTSITIKKLRSKWGSCSPDQRLVFNRDLVHLPSHIIRYVVAHEIAHLQQKHHKKSFWDLVASLYPDYTEARAYLRGIMMVKED